MSAIADPTAPGGDAAPAAVEPPGGVVVQGVWKSYGDKTVLERVDLAVEKGAFVSMVGASGCGKSTFLRMILGAERPSRGVITMDGEKLPPEPGPDRGVVFQRYSTFPHLTCLENVALGPTFAASPWLGRLFGAKKRAVDEKARAMLEAVGLGSAATLMPSALSGGVQQRLAFAQTLMMTPKVLLLDDPFGALDPGIRLDMHELVTSIWRERRMTVFIVTHDLGEAFKLGTRVLTFDKPRRDPHDPDAYGARITYDLPGHNSLDPDEAGQEEAAAA